jgi:hypothetical protein
LGRTLCRALEILGLGLRLRRVWPSGASCAPSGLGSGGNCGLPRSPGRPRREALRRPSSGSLTTKLRLKLRLCLETPSPKRQCSKGSKFERIEKLEIFEAREAREARKIAEAREVRQIRDAREAREIRSSRLGDSRSSKSSKGSRSSRSSKGSRSSRGSKTQ